VCLIICLAVVLISAAVLFSVLRAVLPYATGYKNEIQLEVSQQIGLPVEIGSIDADIHWFSPRLKLIGVSIFDEKNKVPLFNFKEAFVELDVIASIMHRDIIVADVGLVGADISIEKISESEWSVQGIKFTSEGSSELPEQFVYMLQNSDFLLHDSNIYYQDHTGEKLTLSLLDINMDVKNNFNNHEIKFSMNLPETYGKSLIVVADLKGEIDSLNGEVYVEAKQVKVKQWNEKFKFLQKYEIDTVLDVNLWSTLDNNTVQILIAQLTSKNLSIVNTKTAKRWKTKYLTTNLRYVQKQEHWNLAVSDFYFGSEKKASWGRPATVLASDDEEYYYLSADFLRLVDLKKIADVLLTAELRKKLEDSLQSGKPIGLNAYQLNADVYNLSLQLPKEMSKEKLLDSLTVQASIIDFSMLDNVNGIKLSGFDASLRYSKKQAVIELQTKDAEVELKDMLRNPVSAEILQGELTLDYIDDNWGVNTSQLQLKNSHINSFSRLNLQVSADNKIFVDAQTDFYDGYGKYATYYLPVGVMTPVLIEWLDMAVTDGYVPKGTFLLRGELSKFPYESHDGIFQAMFSPQDVSMKFMEGWPLLTDASGTVKFNNLSLILTNAKGKTHNVEMYNGYAEFLDLTNPHLTVKTDARGKNEEVQSYVWNSPLDEILGDSMRLFQFEGGNELTLSIEVPLDKDKIDVSVDGHLTFIDTEIYYPALGYEINGINGVVDFTKESVFADSVTARINNRPVSINAFTEKGDSGQQVVFHLDGVVGIDYLLQRYDRIPKDWLAGESEWSMDFEVPYEPEDYLVHITANSYLEDVVVQMSDKVQKPAARKVAINSEINVLGGGDLQVNAKFTKQQPANKEAGKLIDLFAVRNENKVWNFDIRSEYITGKGEFTEGLDKDTQLKLDLKEVNVHSLFVSKDNKESASPLIPTEFPPLRWQAEKVLWNDWVLTDVKLETDWHKHGMLINSFKLKAPAMVFDARGTWLTSWNGSHETVMQGSISSSNCGETLVGLGYQRSLDRCGYEATFSSKWPAEPHGLSWANMKGKSTFEMKDGEILEVDPGAGGRLLGLLNIFKLANRLAFDFDDVTRKGFSFDTIKGDFEFVNGNGSLKNLDVSAPAADINMFGSIGMVKHDYGLLMRVKPHTDTLTFAGAALLGGVVVGAGVALIQKVFDLGIIGHNVYSITGTWDEPIIEKIVERNPDTADDEDF
jgi:uncharacterized protein YhdP